ncbi:putative DNA helicase INO80 [Varroa jacobsoni]|uniref:putative DNA helicase INO80 n=1 Tax=Varroa jacobsoni TaxID=62625 RepID=UPI000BF86C44|nr:putative DNA helicase INO80 [Varroa jacobsoni]
MWNGGSGSGVGGGVGTDSFSPGLIEDDTPTLPGDKKWRRLCAYLSVLLALSIAGVGSCFAVAVYLGQGAGLTYRTDMEVLLIGSPIIIPGLLALYLCTRNCCGVILNLFFSSAAVGCGVGLYLSGFSRSLGIMFIIVGLLMMVVIILALIYHKFTGKTLCYYEDYDDDSIWGGMGMNESVFALQRAYPNCAPLRRLNSSIRRGSQRWRSSFRRSLGKKFHHQQSHEPHHSHNHSHQNHKHHYNHGGERPTGATLVLPSGASLVTNGGAQASSSSSAHSNNPSFQHRASFCLGEQNNHFGDYSHKHSHALGAAHQRRPSHITETSSLCIHHQLPHHQIQCSFIIPHVGGTSTRNPSSPKRQPQAQQQQNSSGTEDHSTTQLAGASYSSEVGGAPPLSPRLPWHLAKEATVFVPPGHQTPMSLQGLQRLHHHHVHHRGPGELPIHHLPDQFHTQTQNTMPPSSVPEGLPHIHLANAVVQQHSPVQGQGQIQTTPSGSSNSNDTHQGQQQQQHPDIDRICLSRHLQQQQQGSFGLQKGSGQLAYEAGGSSRSTHSIHSSSSPRRCGRCSSISSSRELAFKMDTISSNRSHSTSNPSSPSQ